MPRIYDAQVICPYYRGEKGCAISCESPVRSRVLDLQYASRGEKDAFKAVVCGSFFYRERCAIARANESKYEGE